MTAPGDIRRSALGAAFVLLGWLATAMTGCGESPAASPETRDAGVADTGSLAEDASPGGDSRKNRPAPIVLAHGFAGFDHLVEVDELAYYFDVKPTLTEAGHEVMIGEVDPFNDSTRRGEQLLDEIEGYLANSEYEQVHIIGHSQGGLDARYVAHHRPDLVASVVTISTPHRGTLVADVVLELVDHDLSRAIADEIVKLFGKPLYDEAGDKTSVFAALEQFSSEGTEAFNAEITNADGVYYASVAGRTDGHLGKSVCENDSAPSFIREWRSTSDPVDPLLELTEDIVDGTDEDPKANDGLVRVTEAKWGEFLGCIPADHLDEVGQLLGDDPGGNNDWNHRDFYLDLADYLRSREE